MALACVKIIMADSNEPYLFGDLSCFNFQLTGHSQNNLHLHRCCKNGLKLLLPLEAKIILPCMWTSKRRSVLKVTAYRK